MTGQLFFSRLLLHLTGRGLPFNLEDVEEVDAITGMITLRNDEHPYIIRIEKLPIESDYDDEKKVNILSGTKQQ